MKTLLHLMTLVLIASGSFAQTGFKNNYFDASDNIGTDVCQTSDGGYIMCGMHSVLNGAGQKEFRPTFVKTDSTGKMEWSKTLSSNYGPTNICLSKDGGYMVFGGSSIGNNQMNGKAALLKLSVTGDSIWMKPVNCISSAWPNSWKGPAVNTALNWKRALIATADSCFFLVGPSASNSNSLYFSKMSVRGDSLMSDTLQVSASPLNYNVQATQAGGLIILLRDSNLLRLNLIGSNGTRIWQKNIATPGCFLAGPVVCETLDGGFIAGGQLFGNSNQSNYFKTNGNGDILWSNRVININSAAIGSGIRPDKDQGFLLFGADKSDPFQYTGTSFSLAKIDSLGNPMWSVKFAPDNNQNEEAYSWIQTRDGGSAICGQAKNYITNASGLMLIKTNEKGSYFSTIKGRVYLDKNHNCRFDSTDTGLANQQVKLSPAGIITNTDSLGFYSFQVGTGTYTITSINGKFTSSTCPANGTSILSASTLGSLYSDLNFADTALATCPDLSVTAGTCGLGLCYRNAYTINYANKGLVADSNASVSIKPDNDLIFLSSSIPWVYTAPNTYTFNLGLLKAGQTGSFQIIDSVSCAAITGTTECVKARIYSSMQECDTTNNNVSDCRQITSSLDPNEMLVAVQNTKSPVFVNQQVVNASDSLQYFIRFQNTGTGAAVNISISDTLSAELDAGTVVLGTSSAPCSLINKNGILTFNFSQIMLPDSSSNAAGSAGFVSFYVHQKKNNAAGTLIHNRASIVFDFNKAVATNNTLNYIPLVTGIQEGTAKAEMQVYPNPAGGDHFNLEFNALNQGKEVLVVLYDLQGRETYSKILITTDGSHPTASVDPANTLAPGIYLIVATSDNRIYKQKLIIE